MKFNTATKKIVRSCARVLVCSFSLLLLSCSGVGGLGFGSEIITGTSGSSATGTGSSVTTGGSDDSGSSGSGSGTGDSSASPQASIPLPNAKSELIVAFAADDYGNVPVKAYEGALSYDESYQWLITADDPKSYVSRTTLSLASSAYADDFDTGGLCEKGVCCPIDPLGSSLCYLPTSASLEHVYYSIVDADGQLVTGYDADTDSTLTADIVKEPVNNNLLWVAGNVPSDLSATDDTVTVLANETLVSIIDRPADQLRMGGDYEDLYYTGEGAGSRLAFDSTNNTISVMDSVNGLSLKWYSDGIITDLVTDLTVPGATGYTNLKYLEGNNFVYFGIENDATGDDYSNAFLRAVKSDASWSSESFESDHSSDIQFIAFGDTDADGNALHHTKTLAFDTKTIDTIPWTVIAYLDETAELRVRWVKATGSYMGADLRYGAQSSLGAYTQIPELVFYHGASNAGRFALLDSEHNQVLFGAITKLDDTSTLNLDTAAGVAVGANPTAMTLDDQKRLVVVNQNDQSVSVVSLFNSDGVTPRTSPQVIGTIALSTLTPEKALPFKPERVINRNGTLLITDQSIKAVMMMDLASVSLPSIADETPAPASHTPPAGATPTTWYLDDDGDGFGDLASTKIQPRKPLGPWITDSTDCDDADPTAYPGATEICGDSIDQDCNGSDTSCRER